MAALIDCPACNTKVSLDAHACPKCAHPFKAAPKKKDSSSERVGLFLLICVACFAAWKWIPRSSKEAVGRLVSGSQTLFDEEFSVGSKRWKAKGFTLNRDAAVEVSIQANRSGVNVYVVNESDYKKFKSAKQALFGGKFRHYTRFEMKRANRNSKEYRLGAGRYYVIVENPKLDFLGKSDVTAHLKVVLRP